MMITRRIGNSVSLFPFLAVLVCAMGALIFLLLIVTRQIRAEARAEATEARAEVAGSVRVESSPAAVVVAEERTEELRPVDPLRPVFDAVAAVEVDWGGMLDQLSARLGVGELELVRASEAVAMAESRRRAVQAERIVLRKAEAESVGRREELESSLRRLRGGVDELFVRLRQKRLAASKLVAASEPAESQYVFLPFDSRTGTRRRPIFIECHPDRIQFASEKINLTAKNLAGASRHDNPLLAGVQALVDHWSQTDRAAGVDSQPPYVLMVVRPGGIHAYYLARKLLSRLEAPIGYELVPEAMPLAWPEEDIEATAVCREAIERAVVRRVRRVRLGSGVVERGSGGVTSGRRVAVLEGSSGTGRRAGDRGAIGDGAGGGRRAGAGIGTGSGTGSGTGAGTGAGTGTGTGTGAETGTGSSGSGESPTFEALTSSSGTGSSGGGGTGQESRQGSGQGSGQAVDGAPRQWGVASLGATIGYERRVRVRIDSDRIRVGDQPGFEIATGGGGELTAAEIRQKVVRSVQLTTRSWGNPPDRFYWVPAIRFEVTPGGFLFYERLNRVFRSWRLSTSVDFTLPPVSQPPLRLMQGLFDESEELDR